MATWIQPDYILQRTSTVPGDVPPNLLRGEFAVNLADEVILVGDASGPPLRFRSQSATLMSQLTNVAVAPVAVAAANIAGVLVRDSSVATETSPGAWKVTTILDAGTF